MVISLFASHVVYVKLLLHLYFDNVVQHNAFTFKTFFLCLQASISVGMDATNVFDTDNVKILLKEGEIFGWSFIRCFAGF